MIFKCKMCGGDLQVLSGSNIAECEYCGTRQTVPTLNNDKKQNLFNRANRLRMSNEFSRAATVYESIVAEFPEEAEAYWGLCLCKYGIEYVDDPKTGKKIPTCHRTSYESIFDDSNFDLALEYSDSNASVIYRDEAKEIDRLQKEILRIASKEEPFDVFICYKETAEDGQRTKDSVLAQDIYDKLTEKGYKVFFSRITLEDKLGQEYEPFIFSALNSAKVMLAIGTKYEYYNAVWVKNEWSRYLEMMKKDKNKLLIPCYADIDAYDMPQEFKNLQGQDMNKIGFIQDLIRGIGKVVGTEESKKVTDSGDAVVQRLEQRMYELLKEHSFDKIENITEQILNLDSTNSSAYLGKFMCGLKVSGIDELREYGKRFTDHEQFKKTYQFANEELKRILDECVEENDKYIHYTKALKANETESVEMIEDAIITFESMPGYKDCYEKAIQYKKELNELKLKIDKKKAEEERDRAKKRKIIVISSIFSLVLICVFSLYMLLVVPESKYNSALNYYLVGEYDNAIELFEQILEHKDSKEYYFEAKLIVAKEAYYEKGMLEEYKAELFDLMNDGFNKASDEYIKVYEEINEIKIKEAKLKEEKRKEEERIKDEYENAMNAIEGTWHWNNYFGYYMELINGVISYGSNPDKSVNNRNEIWEKNIGTYEYNIETKDYDLKFIWGTTLTFDGERIRMYDEYGDPATFFDGYADRY